MSADARRSNRATAAGILSALAAQAGLVVSGIIVARALGPTDRGLLALVTLVPLILWQLGSLGLPLSVTYFVARSESSVRPVSKILRRARRVQLAVLMPLGAAGALSLAEFRGNELLVPAVIALGVIPAQLVHQYMLALLLGLRRWHLFYALRVLPVAVWIAGLIVFFSVGVLNLLTAALSYTASHAVTALLSTAVVRRHIAAIPPSDEGSTPAPSFGWMTRFGIRGLLGSASVTQTYRLDQAIVGLFLPPAALGIYVVALSLTTLPRFIAQSIGFKAYPETARQHDWRAARRTLWSYFWLAVVACSVVVGALWLTAPVLLPFFFGSEFARSVPVVRILLLATLLVSIQRVLIDGARGIGRPGIGSLSELALLTALVPAAGVLMPRAGLEGVSWALVIASAVGFVFVLSSVLLARADTRTGPETMATGAAPAMSSGP